MFYQTQHFRCLLIIGIDFLFFNGILYCLKFREMIFFFFFFIEISSNQTRISLGMIYLFSKFREMFFFSGIVFLLPELTSSLLELISFSGMEISLCFVSEISLSFVSKSSPSFFRFCVPEISSNCATKLCNAKYRQIV